MTKKIGIVVAVALAAALAAPTASLAAKKKSDADWRNTPIPNQSAQFYRSNSKTHKSSKAKTEPKS
jgi:hypothetical protein